MTDYYVRKTGLDANDGTNPTTQAWLTIDKAANTIAAADNVYVGAGVYRELVTMDTPGSSGNQISYIADVDGEKTGDAGLVIISAYANETSVATRAACVDPDGRIFVTWRGFCMVGGTSGVVYSGNATDDNYEGCIFEDCVFEPGHTVLDNAMFIAFNSATTPTNDGLIIRRCIVNGGGCRFFWDGNETADQNLKIKIESCGFIGHSSSSSDYNGVMWNVTVSGTYASGGIDVNNCVFIGVYYGVSVLHGASTTYPVDVRNCYIKGRNGLLKQTSDDGALTSDYNHFNCFTDYTNVTAGANDKDDADLGPQLLGGIGDLPLYRFWGWSPYRPWEPIRLQDDSYIHHVIGAADTSVAPAFDLYNEARPMAGRGGERTDTYYFDGSDAAAVQDGVGWSNVTNADDGDTATSATTSTGGDVDNDYLMIEGTNAPASGGAIQDVEVRIYLGAQSNYGYMVRTDGWAEQLKNASDNDSLWTDWTTLSTPSGGWTWAKVQALEFRIWYIPDVDGVDFAIGQIRVATTPTGQDDIGAVEGRARAEKETTTKRTGDNAIRFDGAGFHDILLPVDAASTTVTIYGQYDGTYAGTLPQLKALNIPGIADQTDTMTGASGSWESLSVNFTPGSAGVARIRLVSSDTSAGGECFFDDLAIS